MGSVYALPLRIATLNRVILFYSILRCGVDVGGNTWHYPYMSKARNTSTGSKAMDAYSQRLMNADGTTSTVAEIAAEMINDGTARRLVDAWLMGLSLRNTIAAR